MNYQQSSKPRPRADGIETYESRVNKLYKKRDDLPVIKIGTPEWNNWMRYFSRIGHPHHKPNSFANSHGKMTVPEIDPETFDPGFHCSNHNKNA